SRLPERFRVPLVLCFLESKTRAQAAAELGWAEGTLSSRLARGKELLRAQLLRRGATLSAAAVSTLLAQEATARTLPWTLVQASLKVKSLFLLSEAAGAGDLTTRAAVLAEGALKAMMLTKFKTAAAIIVFAGLLGLGSGLVLNAALARQQAVEEPKPALSV